MSRRRYDLEEIPPTTTDWAVGMIFLMAALFAFIIIGPLIEGCHEKRGNSPEQEEVIKEGWDEMLKKEKINLIVKELRVIDNDTLVNFIHDMFGENDYLYELIRSHLIHYPQRKTDYLFDKYIIKKKGD